MRSTFVRAALVGALITVGCGQPGNAPSPSSPGLVSATGGPTPAATTAPPPSTVAPTRTPAPSVPTARAIRPVLRVELEGADGLQAVGDVLWVRDADSVHRLDRETLEVEKSVRIPEEFGPFAIAGGAIWITAFEDNAIAGYSISSGKEVARIPVGLHPNVVFEADGSVWGYNLHGRFIERIDPEARETEKEWTLTEMLGRPTAPITADAIWFGAYDHQRVVAIEPATNEVAASIQVKIGACGANVFPTFLLVDACDSKVVAKVDAEAGTVLDVVTLPGRAYGWWHVGALAWTILAPSPDQPTTRLVGFDPVTLEPRDAVDVGGKIHAAIVAFDALWVTTEDGVMAFELAEIGG